MTYKKSERGRDSASGDVLITCSSLGKRFCRDIRKSLWYGVTDSFNELRPSLKSSRTPTLRSSEFWANKDISFEVARGECLGLIGCNGAGKTTLLKMLTGLIKPDTGETTLRGRVGGLIALGAGFNPILTGRENIYVNGAILGLTKTEIRDSLDEIVQFAELDDAINAPVNTYSSGMLVRLGFSIATILRPDILILDEVLAVGDVAFRNKCYNRIAEMRSNAAVIFVSHSMQQVSQICTKAIVLSNGRAKFIGDVGSAVQVYEELNQARSQNASTPECHLTAPVTFARLTIPENTHWQGREIIVDLQIDLDHAVKNSSIRIAFYDAKGLTVAEANSKASAIPVNLVEGKNRLSFALGPIHLNGGYYDIGFVVYDETGTGVIYWSYKEHKIKIEANTVAGSAYVIPMKET